LTSFPLPSEWAFAWGGDRPLEEALAAGGLRKDLQGRLEAFVVELPLLRERVEDLGILVGFILLPWA
jgi:DNA-binding NtrC family response regulator